MFTRSPLVILFCFFTAISFAQGSKQSFLSAAVGVGVPVSPFGGQDGMDDNHGQAKPGVQLSIRYEKDLTDQYGWTAGIRYNRFARNGEPRRNLFTFDPEWKYSSKPYHIIGLYGGMFRDLTNGTTTTLKLTGMLGVNLAKYAPVTVTYVDEDRPSPLVFENTSDAPMALAPTATVGASLYRKLTGKLGLKADVFLTYSPVKYNVTWKQYSMGQNLEEKERIELPVTAVGVDAGVVWSLK